MPATRAFRRVLIAGLVGFLGGGAAVSLFAPRSLNGQTAAQVIRANRFILLDNDGQKRGEWIIGESGHPLLRMFDERGNVMWSTEMRLTR